MPGPVCRDYRRQLLAVDVSFKRAVGEVNGRALNLPRADVDAVRLDARAFEMRFAVFDHESRIGRGIDEIVANRGVSFFGDRRRERDQRQFVEARSIEDDDFVFAGKARLMHRPQ